LEDLWILPVAVFVLLDIGALYVVVNEDLLYEPSQKFWKVIFILFVPFIGAIRELWLLSRYVQYKDSRGGDDSQWYAFWDHYSNASVSPDGDTSGSGYDGGSSGDGGGGGGD